MVILGVFLAQITKTILIDAVKDRVVNEGEFISTYVKELPSDNETNMEHLKNLSNELEIGMVFYNQKGQVTLDTINNVISYNETNVQQLREYLTQNNTVIKSTKDGQLYDNIFFYPIRVNEPSLKGSLVLVIAVSSLRNLTFNIWFLIGVTILIGIIAISYIGYHLFNKYIRPIRSATSVANQLAKGNYNARTYVSQIGDVGELSNAINILAKSLQKITTQNEMQQGRLKAVLENMGSGVMLIDDKGYIHLVNRAFLETFGGDAEDYLEYLYYQAIPEKIVHKVVKDTFMVEERVRETIVLSRDIHRRFIEVTGAPIFNHAKDWQGIVLVFHDITDLKKLEQTRKDFVANVSHELKTPITSIRGFSETLLEGAMDDEGLREQFLSIILKESRRLQSLIHDLLELSKLEKENLNLNVEKIKLPHLIKDVLSLVEYLAKEKEIELLPSIDGDYTIEGDSARFKQVIINLITNAIHYTPKGGKVMVELSHQGDFVELTVKDTGIGIPQEDVPRIFERFYRVDKARSRDSGGTGLGLAIVKHIVEAHRGKIKVESEPQKGTSFHIFIPKRA